MQSNEIVAGANYAHGDTVRRVLSITEKETVLVKELPGGLLKKATDANVAKWEKTKGDLRDAQINGDAELVTKLQKSLGFVSLKRQACGGLVEYREGGQDIEMPRSEFSDWAERRVR